WLRERPDARRRLGEAARRLVREQYTWRSVVDRILQIARPMPSSAASEGIDEGSVKRHISLPGLRQTPEISDDPGAVAAPPLAGWVRFEDVSFGYGDGHPAILEHVSFEVARGQRVALVGPSGASKSTICNLLLRLYDPDQGQILIGGRDLREYTLSSLRAQFSVVIQDTLLPASTVSENISYGAPDATREDVELAARLANAHEFIQALP